MRVIRYCTFLAIIFLSFFLSFFLRCADTGSGESSKNPYHL
jgi:hypothetical protein